MHWVKEFYSLQNKWLQIYLGDVDEWHQGRAKAVLEWAKDRSAPLQILELGAGGGQTAIALAQQGHHLTTIELLDDSVQHARQLAQTHHLEPQIHIIQGDFYEVELPVAHFDIVCYFDSFGIGSDEDQRHLLRRIKSWLKPNGIAVVEVGMPWYWANKARGQRMDFEGYTRIYDFDPDECRLMDYWFPTDQPELKVWQRLRCYAPADMRMLLQGTGLQLSALKPNGYVDYSKMQWVADAPLIDCMTYYTLLMADGYF